MEKADELNAIGKKTAKGALWVSIAQIASRSLGTIRIVALAAIVPLAELGLFGIALVAIQLIERISETGMRQALIQKEGTVEEYLGTAWSAQIVRGIVLAIVLFAASGPIETFFEKEGIQSLVIALSVLPLMQGLQNVGIVYLHRELKFERITMMNLASAVTDLLVSVVLAIFWKSAFALVIGKIAGMFVLLCCSYLVENRRASLSFSSEKFRELYSFGFWVFLSAILSFILIRGGDLVIGKLLSEEALAIYQIAYGIACIPIMEVLAVVNMTTYSAFSRMQGDRERLRHAFVRVFTLSSFVMGLSLAGFAAISFDFTRVFFKPEVYAIAAMLPPLAIWGACRAFGSMNSVLFQAMGRPALATVFQFLMLILFIVLLIPMAYRFEIAGVIWSLVAIGLLAQVGRLAVLANVLELPATQLVSRIGISISVAIVAYLPTMAVFYAIPAELTLVRMVTCLFVLLTVYFAAAYFTDSKLKFGITDFFAEHVPAVKRFQKSMARA